MTRRDAQNIVNAILQDLEGRRGFGVIGLVKDDTEVYEAMYGELTDVVLEAFRTPDDPKDHWMYGGPK